MSTLGRLESDEIDITSGLVHVSFKNLFRYYKTFTAWLGGGYPELSTHQGYFPRAKALREITLDELIILDIYLLTRTYMYVYNVSL